MRGVTLLAGVGEKEKEVWCPLVYEYLPDFCFIYVGGLVTLTNHVSRNWRRERLSKRLRLVSEKWWLVGQGFGKGEKDNKASNV